MNLEDAMPAIVANLKNRWTDHVPFTVDKTFARGRTWLLGKVLEFNQRVGRNVFVTMESNEAHYVVFKNGHNSPIGMQLSGVQELKCDDTNLFHEMGHCLGLGHTYFHTASRLPALFDGADEEAFTASKNTYVDQGLADVDSAMGYTPGVFVNSPRIARVWDLKSAVVGQTLAAARTALQQLIDARAAPAPASVAARFLFQVPQPFGHLALSYEIKGVRQKRPVPDFNALALLKPADLAQFMADLDIVEQYWKFTSADFMMHLSDDDVAAIKAVVKKS